MSTWTHEDYLRNEAESERYIDQIDAALSDRTFIGWLQGNEGRFFSPAVAAQLQHALMTAFVRDLDEAQTALRQLAALAEEAREEAEMLREKLRQLQKEEL